TVSASYLPRFGSRLTWVRSVGVKLLIVRAYARRHTATSANLAADSRLCCFHFGRAADDAEAGIFRPGRAIRSRIGWAIGASADDFALSVAGHHPLGNVAPEIVNRLFVVFSLTVE